MSTSKLTVPAALAALSLVLSSCTLLVNDGLQPSPAMPGDAELQSFQGTFMVTFDILNGSNATGARALTPFAPGAAQAGPRATVPIFGATSIALPAGTATVSGSKTDYPEPGQSSSWSVTRYAPLANVYQVDVTTTFPAYDTRSKQVESYLIKDKGVQDADFTADGQWTTADLVVDQTGAQNDAFRLYNRLSYRDGSYQDEVITTVKKPTTAGNMQPGFTAWDINASLDYPALFTPVSDTTATYSSVVAYTRTFSDAPSYSFWAGNRAQTIVGVRYYTEHLNAAKTQLIADMILFEKAVTSYQTTSGSFADAASTMFLPAIGSNPNPTLLAQSFLRQEVVYAWNDTTKTVSYSSASRDTRMKTTVVNISGQTDWYINRVNSEAAQLTSGDTTISIPSGDAAELLATDPGAAADVKSKNLTVKTGDLEPVQVTTNTPSGDLGTLWVSLDQGAASNAPSTGDITNPDGSVATDLSGSGDIKQFSGKQGVSVTTASLPAVYSTGGDVSGKGTVQAWIYINAHSNSAGVVHCGTKADFSDEIWSLQFMRSKGQIGMSLSTNSVPYTAAAYTYDWVGSTYNLNTKKWYYVVVTWDRTLGTTNSYIKLYLNGVLNRKGAMPNCTKSTAKFQVVNAPVVIGSQFYDATKVLSGYYGFNGKVNGVQVSTTVMADADILAFYNANSDKTTGW